MYYEGLMTEAPMLHVLIYSTTEQATTHTCQYLPCSVYLVVTVLDDSFEVCLSSLLRDIDVNSSESVFAV